MFLNPKMFGSKKLVWIPKKMDPKALLDPKTRLDSKLFLDSKKIFYNPQVHTHPLLRYCNRMKKQRESEREHSSPVKLRLREVLLAVFCSLEICLSQKFLGQSAQRDKTNNTTITYIHRFAFWMYPDAFRCLVVGSDVISIFCKLNSCLEYV